MHAETGDHEVTERPGAERRQSEGREASRRERVRKRERVGVVAVPERRDEPDPELAGPAERPGEHASRTGIEPLEIVDPEHRRPLVREDAQESEHGGGEGEPVRGLVAGTAAESGVERGLLGPRQLVAHLGGRLPEQVGERAEGDRHLDLRAARALHARSRRLDPIEPDPPERRLPDAGLAGDHERSRARLERSADALQVVEIGVATDQLARRGYRHEGIVAHARGEL